MHAIRDFDSFVLPAKLSSIVFAKLLCALTKLSKEFWRIFSNKGLYLRKSKYVDNAKINMAESATRSRSGQSQHGRIYFYTIGKVDTVRYTCMAWHS